MTRDETIIELHRSGTYPEEIARVVGFSKGSSVVRVLKRLHEPLKGISGYQGNKNSKRYSIDGNFFEQIDTQEKAYWLGFLFADGYNTEAYRITINLQWGDREHLERLKLSLGSSHPIIKRIMKIKKLNEVARLDVNCRKICLDLANHGMVKAKSLVLKWPITVPTELLRHFIRGYFDGDGCITPSKTAVGCISFCSSHSFIASLKKYLVRELDFSKNKVEDTGNAAVVRWSGREIVERFFHFIYKDATVYLPRKKEKMEKLLTLN